MIWLLACTPDADDTGKAAPLELVEVGRLPDVVAVGLSGDGSRVATHTWDPSELVVIDTSDPAAPAIAWQRPTPAGKVMTERIGGDHLYVVYERMDDGDGGVEIYDLRQPDLAPAWVGEPLVRPHSAQVVGDRLYVSDHTQVHVFDVTDPMAPTLVSTYVLPEPELVADELLVDGDTLFVSARKGLLVLDVSASPPALVGLAPYPDGVLHTLARVGDDLYTSDEVAGGSLRRWEVSDPAAPLQGEALAETTHPNIYSLALYGGRLWAAWYEEGLRSWSTDGEPHEEESFNPCDCADEVTEPPSGVQAVWASDTFVVLSDAQLGLYFLTLE